MDKMELTPKEIKAIQGDLAQRDLKMCQALYKVITGKAEWIMEHGDIGDKHAWAISDTDLKKALGL